MKKITGFIKKISSHRHCKKSSENHPIGVSEARDPETNTSLPIIRFDEEFRIQFKFWRITGTCPVDWDKEKCEYVSKRGIFVAFYCLVIMTILSCSSIAIWNGVSSPGMVQLEELINILLIVFSGAVVPAFQAYCTKLMYTNMPELLVKMGHLTYLTREYRPKLELFREMFTFNLMTRKKSDEIQRIKSKEKITIDDVAYLLPKSTIAFSIFLVNLFTIICIAILSISRYCLQDWKFFFHLIEGMFFPMCISSFSITIFSWMKASYEAVKIKLQHALEESKTRKPGEKSEIFLCDTLDEVSHELTLVNSTLQEVFARILKFPISISIFTYVVIAMVCFIRLMQDYNMVFLYIPMFSSLHSILMLCYGAEKVVQQVRKMTEFLYACFNI